MRKNFKKLLSLILVFSFLVTFIFSTYVNAQEESPSLTNQDLVNSLQTVSSEVYDKYPELKEINANTVNLLNTGADFKEVISKIPQSNLEKLRNVYKELDCANSTGNSNIENSIKSEIESNGINAEQYIKSIDDLAKEYYEYYKIHNEFPDNSSKDVTTLAVTYDPCLTAIGYSVTATALAEQLASLTTICATAFPYVALIALLVGATILVASIVYDYVDNYEDVNSAVLGWYSGKATQTRVLKSCADTQTLVTYRVVYNIKYWQAFLVNFAGLGGIAIGQPLTDANAVSRLSMNSEVYNTYAVLESDAGAAAQLAGLGCVRNDPHNYGTQILNKPHYHPLLAGGVQSHSHSFFGL